MDNGAIQNYILPTAIKKMELPYRQKKNPYLLITISGDLILYKDSIIHFKIEPIKVIVKK